MRIVSHMEWIAELLENPELDLHGIQEGVGGVFIHYSDKDRTVVVEISEDPYTGGAFWFFTSGTDVDPREVAEDFKGFLKSKGIDTFNDRGLWESKVALFLEAQEAA